MPKLTLYFDGSRTEFGIDRVDRDEVDQFLDDVAMTGGGHLLTDEGPLALPAGGQQLRYARVVIESDEWLADRVGGEDLDDD